jgi:hypothetical protein
MQSSRRTAFRAVVLGVAAALAFAGGGLAKTSRPARAEVQPAALAAPELGAETSLVPDYSDLPSGVTSQLASWIAVNDDNDDLPFMIVDKQAAVVFAFDAYGGLIGHAPVLVGLARGDDSEPGIGQLALSAIAPDERTTPAGRFLAHLGPSDHGEVLWVDDRDAISMHPVITTNPAEHRLQRIKSASPDDHRISFGCINVPAKFYESVVKPSFVAGGVVYVLPDTKSVAQVFPAFAGSAYADAAARAPERCDDPLRDVPDGIPNPDPAMMCPIDDGTSGGLATR